MAAESPSTSTRKAGPSKASSTNESNEIVSASLARAETTWINCLRAAVLLVLLVAAIGLSTAVFLYTRNEERNKFTTHFDDSSHQVIESFHDMVQRNIGAAAALSTTMTSYALDSNQSFPFVTLPDFALRGAHARIQAGSHIIHWFPLVTDANRKQWEEYAYQNRDHIDEAFENDQFHRNKQDAEIEESRHRYLQQQVREQRNMTILDDGTGYHPHIWSNGALTTPGDEPKGAGPYLPAWQRSPIAKNKQSFLNLNFAATKVIGPGLLDTMMQEKKAVLRNAAIPIPKYKEALQANLKISQYRDQVDDFVDGLSSFVAYPVFGSFDEDKEVVGVLATNVYWKVLFSHLLPTSDKGIICVVENSYNQVFTYRIDGPEAVFLGMGDLHDLKYDELGVRMSLNDHLKDQFSAQNRAYSTVPLSDEVQYRLTVYPSQDTEDGFVTNEPAIYTAVILLFFVFASLLFLLFSYVVERRQHIMLNKVVENANRVASAERELNEFLSHEVRNPLAAAISACSFITTAINEPNPLADADTRQCTREDMEVVNSSLHFINDFLRSMLDIHKASSNQIKINNAPSDVLQDILEPVSAILYTRVAGYELILDCPEGLIIQTDAIRLKQVVLNLARNASKFVEHGFIRLRAMAEDNNVTIYVEDSGVGVPQEKRTHLFAKYQPSLDLLSQGTGLGLSLSKKLMDSMGGDIYLDETYDSGIPAYPGACFIIQLNTSPVDIESTLPTESETEIQEHAVLGNEIICTEQRCPDTPSTCLPPDVSGQEAKTNGATTACVMPAQDIKPESSLELPEELSVLLVDDDAVLRKLFVRAVKKARPNWAIQEAASGEKALQLCETEKFDLIFLDQYMASVEKQLLGTETATAMRSRGVKSIICGLSANDIKDTYIRAGADNFILKPIPCKAEELKKVLVSVLNKEAC